MAIGSVGDSSRFQIIQSHINRQRIDEQYNRSNLEEKSTSVLENQAVAVSKTIDPEKVSEAEYSQAHAEFNSYSQKSNKVSAYQSVFNQERRDAISEQYGVSVYA